MTKTASGMRSSGFSCGSATGSCRPRAAPKRSTARPRSNRREREQWLAREVAVRTRDLEERTTVVEDIALTALAAAGDWPGAGEAVEKLAKELGTSADDVSREIRKRQAPA